MRHNQGDLPRVELLFNVGDSVLNGDDGVALEADRAVVLRYPDAEAQWPLDALNDALGVIYAESKDIPRLYPVHGNGPVIGYLAMARDDALTEADLSQRFWEILAYKVLGDPRLQSVRRPDRGWIPSQAGDPDPHRGLGLLGRRRHATHRRRGVRGTIQRPPPLAGG